MKILSQEVKTFYTIEIDRQTLYDIAEKFTKDETASILYKRAFTDFANSGNINEGDTCSYIAKALGFDGWQTAGVYYVERRVYKMVVFNYGDRINQ